MDNIVELGFIFLIVIILIVIMVIVLKSRNKLKRTNVYNVTHELETTDKPFEKEQSISDKVEPGDSKIINVETTGESEFYKEKLYDQRWLVIRKKVLIRDKYVCRECLNCINDIVLLRDNSELINHTKCSQNIFKFVFDIFEQKENIINSVITNEKNHKINNGSYLKYYFPEKDLYLYGKKNVISIYGEKKFPKNEIITTTEINLENVFLKFNKWLHIQEFYRNNKLDNIAVYIHYYSNISTDGKYYLKYHYGNAYKPFNGKWSLHKDGFIVSFDGDQTLEHKDIKLNVHHLFYNRSGNPWDCDLDDLVTLCEKCHIAEHERLKRNYNNRK